MDVFQWLNGQLSEHVSAYLCLLLGPEHGHVAYIQKAWPVECPQHGGIENLHSHRNAQLSAQFYLLTNSTNESGELELRRPTFTSAM